MMDFLDSLGRNLRVLVRKLVLNTAQNLPGKSVVGDGNIILHAGASLKDVTFDINGNCNHINISKGCYLNGVSFFLRGDDHKIVIGEHCKLNRGTSIWMEDTRCCLIIGGNTTIESAHLAVTEPDSIVRIGRDSMLAYDIDIRTGDSHSIVCRNNGTRVNPARDVIIGNHVWIAAHCIILKGSYIGDSSVIASGSVVTKAFKRAGIIVAGNPAKIIKDGIDWRRERVYE